MSYTYIKCNNMSQIPESAQVWESFSEQPKIFQAAFLHCFSGGNSQFRMTSQNNSVVLNSPTSQLAQQLASTHLANRLQDNIHSNGNELVFLELPKYSNEFGAKTPETELL